MTAPSLPSLPSVKSDQDLASLRLCCSTLTFAEFLACAFTDGSDNHHAIISREGRIMIQHRWGAFTYDTIDDFLRAHQPVAAEVTRLTPSAPITPMAPNPS